MMRESSGSEVKIQYMYRTEGAEDETLTTTARGELVAGPALRRLGPSPTRDVTHTRARFENEISQKTLNQCVSFEVAEKMGEFIGMLTAIIGATSSEEPHISSDGEDLLFEWWVGAKKLDIYVTVTGIQWVLATGPNIHEDMTDGEFDFDDGDALTALWNRFMAE